MYKQYVRKQNFSIGQYNPSHLHVSHKIGHKMHWGINLPPSLKNTIPSFLPRHPPLNLQNPSPPFFRQSPLYIGFSRPHPPLKVGFFSEPQKC